MQILTQSSLDLTGTYADVSGSKQRKNKIRWKALVQASALPLLLLAALFAKGQWPLEPSTCAGHCSQTLALKMVNPEVKTRTNFPTLKRNKILFPKENDTLSDQLKPAVSFVPKS